jgi:MFS family permease
MEPQDRPNSDHEMAVMPAPPANEVDRPERIPAATATDLDVSPPRSQWKQVASLFALFSTLFISALNATLLGTALPTISRELHSADGYAWIGAAYILGNAAFGPIWAKLSDIWGRKAILLSAVAGFFFTSIICALAVNIKMLIAGRALQGIAGGGLFTMVTIVISDLFSVRNRSLFLGLLQITWCVAGGVGPVLGGFFSERVSWRWNFWIMLPPCALSWVMLFFALEVYNPRTSLVNGIKAIDWPGSLSILALLIMALLGLNFGGVEYPWSSPTVICLIVVGLAMGIVFVISEKKLARYPILPLGIFTTKSNIAILIVASAHDFALFSSEYYMPFFFQSAKAMTPILAGVSYLPLVLSQSATGLFAGYYIHRTGRYMELIWAGMALMTAGYGSFIAWDAASGRAMMHGTQVLAGIGTGMLFAPPLIALQASVPQSQVATATATVTLVRNVSVVLAVVTGQTIFQNGMHDRQGELMDAGLDERLLDAFSGNSAAAKAHLIREMTDPVQQLAVEQAFAESQKGIRIMDAAYLAFALLCSAFIVKTKLSKEHVETKTGLMTGDEEEQRQG